MSKQLLSCDVLDVKRNFLTDLGDGVVSCAGGRLYTTGNYTVNEKNNYYQVNYTQVSGNTSLAASTALSANYSVMVFADYTATVDSLAGAGEVRIYTPNNGQWTLFDTISDTSPTANGQFGRHVAIDANGRFLVLSKGATLYGYIKYSTKFLSIIVTASDVTFNAINGVAVYGGYIVVAGNGLLYYGILGGAFSSIAPSDVDPTNNVLSTVRISYDGRYIAAANVDTDGSETGQIYIFLANKDYSSVTEQAILTASGGATRFGANLEITADGSYVVATGTKTNASTVYVHKRDGTTWSQVATINDTGFPHFVDDVAIAIDSGAEHINISSNEDSDAGASNAGAIYCYSRRANDTYNLTQRIEGFEATEKLGYYLLCNSDSSTLLPFNYNGVNSIVYTYDSTHDYIINAGSTTINTDSGTISLDNEVSTYINTGSHTGSITITLPKGFHDGHIITVYLGSNSNNFLFGGFEPALIFSNPDNTPVDNIPGSGSVNQYACFIFAFDASTSKWYMISYK